jgi:hypothetical protein
MHQLPRSLSNIQLFTEEGEVTERTDGLQEVRAVDSFPTLKKNERAIEDLLRLVSNPGDNKG